MQRALSVFASPWCASSVWCAAIVALSLKCWAPKWMTWEAEATKYEFFEHFAVEFAHSVEEEVSSSLNRGAAALQTVSAQHFVHCVASTPALEAEGTAICCVVDSRGEWADSSVCRVRRRRSHFSIEIGSMGHDQKVFSEKHSVSDWLSAVFEQMVLLIGGALVLCEAHSVDFAPSISVPLNVALALMTQGVVERHRPSTRTPNRCRLRRRIWRRALRRLVEVRAIDRARCSASNS